MSAAESARRGSGPLWQQLETTLRRSITDGTWSPGAQIPGEAALTELHGVSRITVRHALANLARDGLIQRHRGRGTFVRDTRLVADTRVLSSFTDEMSAIGVAAGSTLLGHGVVEADDHVAEALEVEPGSAVMRLRRLRSGDGEPIGVQTTTLRADRVAGFDAESAAGASLYEVLRRDHDLVALDAVEVFRVGRPSAADVDVLGIDRRTPVFTVERTSRDDVGPFEFTQSTMRGDRYEIRSRLRRQ